MLERNTLQKLTDTFHRQGITEIHYQILIKNEEVISLYKNLVDGSRFSSQCLIFALGNVDGYEGSVCIENLSEDYFDEFIASVKSTAAHNKKQFRPIDFSRQLSASQECSFPSSGEILQDMLETEKEIYANHQEITDIPEYKSVKVKETVLLIDNQGNELTNTSEYLFQIIDIISAKNGISKNAVSYKISKTYDKKIFLSLAAEAAEEAAVLLNSIIPKTGNYKVILKNTVFAEILSIVSSIFYASTIQNGMSPLKGRENTQIFSPQFSLLEDPVHPGGRIYRTFDDEGNPTSSKHIIDKGFFNCALHNRQTAEKENTCSTGNGFKPGIKESISVGVTNLFAEPGNAPMEKLLETMDEGIVISSVQGLHAGINSVTGDISLLSTGFMVSGGKIISGAEQMTVAGNLFDMLNNIVLMGNDMASTAFSSMANLTYMEVPSVLIEKMSVAGK